MSVENNRNQYTSEHVSRTEDGSTDAVDDSMTAIHAQQVPDRTWTTEKNNDVERVRSDDVANGNDWGHCSCAVDGNAPPLPKGYCSSTFVEESTFPRGYYLVWKRWEWPRCWRRKIQRWRLHLPFLRLESVGFD